MTNLEFVNKIKDVADNHKTLYVMGCFGAPLTGGNVSRYCNNHGYNRQTVRTSKIKAKANQNPPVFGFDCVCLIKGILWGWNGDASRTYGGASYAVNGVPDIDCDAVFSRCTEKTTDFSQLVPGEAVWMPGHIGVYVGNGLAVECTPIWADGVQYTACNRDVSGYPRRNWTKHGKLPYINYVSEGEDVKKFSDVKDGAWYAKAVEFCHDNGIMAGISDTKFGVGEPVTREQAALMFLKLHDAIMKKIGK